MSINTKRAIFLLTCISFAMGVFFPVLVKERYQDAISVDVSGVVTKIKWHTKNHDFPLFVVDDVRGRTTMLNNGELELHEGQIGEGDNLTKKKGSKICTINKKEIPCVSDYVSFYSMLGDLLTN